MEDEENVKQAKAHSSQSHINDEQNEWKYT